MNSALSSSQTGAGIKAVSATGHEKVRLHALPKPWRLISDSPSRVWVAGNVHGPEQLVANAAKRRLAALARSLEGQRSQFAIIIETDDTIFVAVDRVHSYPVFLRGCNGHVEISADSSVWLVEENNREFDPGQGRNFLLSGYTLGKETLLRSVSRVLPGEFVAIRKSDAQLLRRRYFAFTPDFSGSGPQKVWQKRLGDALDAAVSRTVEIAHGRRIWLALSAGFDSRVLLGKLLEHGHRDIATFSYGSTNNFEAKIAREIADSMGVSWRFLPPKGRAEINEFWSGEPKRYMLSAGGVSATPSMMEFFALRQLKQHGHLRDGDLFINGQTGDFLTGGHIPVSGCDDFASISAYVLKKHFSLFKSLTGECGQDGIETILKSWAKDTLPELEPSKQLNPFSLYQAFEWQERQSRYVVNGQRAYDQLGLEWQLPLWDSDLMDLYMHVPLHLQRQQKLYVDYLKGWNYRGLFNEMRRSYNPWPRLRGVILGLGALTQIVAGAEAKKNLYRRLYYYTDQNYLYRLFGKKCYLAFLEELRNPASLFALHHYVMVRQALNLAPEQPLEKQYVKCQALRFKN